MVRVCTLRMAVAQQVWYGPYIDRNGYTGGNVYAGTIFITSSSGLDSWY